MHILTGCDDINNYSTYTVSYEQDVFLTYFFRIAFFLIHCTIFIAWFYFSFFLMSVAVSVFKNLNLRLLYAHYKASKSIILQKKFDIILIISESWLHNGIQSFLVKIKEYDFIRNDRNASKYFYKIKETDYYKYLPMLSVDSSIDTNMQLSPTFLFMDPMFRGII